MRNREMYPALERQMILDEETVRELADAAHEFRLHVREADYLPSPMPKRAYQDRVAAEHRLRLAINAVRNIPDDTDWAS